MNKVAVIIPNGNMDEVTQTLVSHIVRNTKSDYKLVVVNNPNGKEFTEGYTLQFSRPLGMTKAILYGLAFVDLEIKDCFAYWICTTSIEFTTEEDYLTPMLNYMVDNPDCVMVSPATNDMAWDCMKQKPGGKWRRVWGVDNICLLIRRDWFDGVGRYDPELKMGWGTTLETCWKARRDGKHIIVDDNLLVKWNDGIAHTMNRRFGVSREEHNSRAAVEMAEVLSKRYGEDWLKKLNNEFKDGLECR